ncbi:MAG: HEAT repeat domain-containing protein, partial [Acidobacteriota bacterium]
MLCKNLLRSPNAWAAVILTVCFAGMVLAQSSPAEKLYREGQDALAEGRYAAAVEHFRALVDEPDARADRALYWRAYAEARAERRSEALSSLARLAEDYPESRWLDDARALQLELGGIQPERAAEMGEDDLKLYALDALMQANPERAVALLESFLTGDHSTRLKKRALFVLSQTNTPRAKEMLLEYARGEAAAELQREAIRALGISGDPSAVAELKTIYRSTESRDMKDAILQSFVAADAADAT